MIRPYELALYCVQGYDIWQETPEEKRLARPGHPEDLEGIAVFLASEASAYISGAVIPVDGGYLGK